jgi:hypothetical protein
VSSIVKSFLSALSALPNPGVWGVLGWDWTNTKTNMLQSWMSYGGCLSYDTQVKMKNTLPYFSTGIGFNLRNNQGTTDSTKDAYGYGLSISRQRQTRCCITLFGCSAWGDTIGGSCLLSGGAENVDDGINPTLRPLTSYSSEETIWTNGAGTAWQQARYSDPVIVLWERNGPATSQGSFKVLAYRVVTAADGLTYCASGAASCTGSDLRLNPFVTLMARIIEGYELAFSSGRVDATGRHFKYGDRVKNADYSKSARIIGTPVMSVDWGGAGSTTAQGKLMLSDVSGSGFTSGDALFIVDGDGSSYGSASSNQDSTKSNWLMAYYSDTTAKGTANALQADNNRIGNVVYTDQVQAYWPPDDATDKSSSNDYFSLVQWHYITPGSNQVSASSSWVLGYGWYPSGSNLVRGNSLGASIGPNMSSGSGWGFGSHWSYSSGIYHSLYLFGSTTSATYNLSTTAGTQYYVSLYTQYDLLSSGSASYTFGGVSGGNITGGLLSNNNYTNTFTASSSSTAFVISGTWNWEGTMTACTIQPWVTPGIATIPLTNPLTAGTTFTASITVSGLGSGESVYYTIGSYTSPTYTSDGTYTITYQLPWTEPSSAGNMIFHSSTGLSDQFTISNISVVPAVVNGTLDATADSQGKVASYVPAVSSGDFYQAVIKTNALTSPSGTSVSDFANAGGVSLALITSSYAPKMGNTTFYDDWAVQMDLKYSIGFLPPIQQ